MNSFYVVGLITWIIFIKRYHTHYKEEEKKNKLHKQIQKNASANF